MKNETFRYALLGYGVVQFILMILLYLELRTLVQAFEWIGL